MSGTGRTYTIAMAGGKTGGHLFPGIAVAEILREQGHAVRFIGSRGGLEEREVPPLGFPLSFITVGGLKGKDLFETIRNLLVLPLALVQSLLVILRHRISAVVSLGGFAAGPAALAARLCGRKVFVLEQNSIPGITNRLVGRFAAVVFTSFPDEKRFFDPRIVRQTGNPVRRAVLSAAPAATPSEGKPVLAVFGGSQGAHSLNEMMGALATARPDLLARYFVVHQTGERDLDMMRDAYARHGIRAMVEPFLRDIGGYYKAAAVIVCRAGATTIAELLALGRAAVYVPFPHAADDHQYHNARLVAGQGGGVVVEDRGALEDKVARLAAAIERYEREREDWERRIAAFGYADASAKVASAIERVLRGERA